MDICKLASASALVRNVERNVTELSRLWDDDDCLRAIRFREYGRVESGERVLVIGAVLYKRARYKDCFRGLCMLKTQRTYYKSHNCRKAAQSVEN